MTSTKTAAGGHTMNDETYLQWWLARLLRKSILQLGGCWIWQGHKVTKGYGITTWRGHSRPIHRKIYEIMHGVELATEQFVCHRCDTRACWNPAHLFVGDAKVNNRDCGNKGRHHNGVKTRCKRGHEYTFENTHLKVTPTTVMRSCLECEKIRRNWPHYKEKARERLRRRRARLRAEKLGVAA